MQTYVYVFSIELYSALELLRGALFRAAYKRIYELDEKTLFFHSP